MTATTSDDSASRRLIDRTEFRTRHRGAATMGTQPALDGIRAISVVLVILYHAGFVRVHGGFFGVEVFFVVSGFLITTLLWEERARTGRISLGRFWQRRARRLLPALFVVLAASTAWAVWFGREHLELLRRDLLPALLYVGNWGQVFGSTPYFSPADPVLRHMWSLAVEEQWYLIWPLAFVGLLQITRSRARVMAGVLAAIAIAIAVGSAVVASSSSATIAVVGRHPDRFNFLYLNTITRSSGLLLGAALALVWRPWTAAGGAGPPRRWAGPLADVVGVASTGGIVAIALSRGAGILADATLYQRWLPLVTLLSATAVGAAVHPGARVLRGLFGSPVITAIGRRSYGLYLWHWPVFVFAGVRSDHARFLPAVLLTAGLAELCYRLVETPVRQGAIGRWWAAADRHDGGGRVLFVGVSVCLAVAAVSVLAVRVARFTPTDPALDASNVSFDPLALNATVPSSVAAAGSSSLPSPGSTMAPGATATATAAAASTVPATTTTLPVLPRSVVIIGDSQAHSLAINLPDGIDSTFTITDGSIDGCGIWDTGTVRSARTGFRRTFDDCVGWQDRWGRSVTKSGARLALVTIGAWDVFDVQVGDTVVTFGTPASDALFVQHLQSGIDAIVTAGAHVALLEVPCMRPVDVKGAGVPALPERGDDGRVRHLNDLLHQIAAANADTVTFVAGPTAWCNDPTIATDQLYRWDGVHVYKPGAKLVFETIAPALVSIPLSAG